MRQPQPQFIVNLLKCEFRVFLDNSRCCFSNFVVTFTLRAPPLAGNTSSPCAASWCRQIIDQVVPLYRLANLYTCTQCSERTLKNNIDDVVLRHTLPVFTRLGRCPIVNWDFAGAVSIFGPDALPVIHQ